MKKIIASILFLMPLVSMAITHKDIEESVAPYFSGDLRSYKWHNETTLVLIQTQADTTFSGNMIGLYYYQFLTFGAHAKIIEMDGMVMFLPIICRRDTTFDYNFYPNRWLRFSLKKDELSDYLWEDENVPKDLLCDKYIDLNEDSIFRRKMAADNEPFYSLDAFDVFALADTNSVYYYTHMGNDIYEVREFFSPVQRVLPWLAMKKLSEVGVDFSEIDAMIERQARDRYEARLRLSNFYTKDTNNLKKTVSHCKTYVGDELYKELIK